MSLWDNEAGVSPIKVGNLFLTKGLSVLRTGPGGCLAILFGLFFSSFSFGEETYFDREFTRARQSLIEHHDVPRSVVYAYECFELRSRLSSPDRLSDLHKQILGSKKAHPVLKGHIEWFQANLDRDLKQNKSALARVTKLGFITDWMVVGPFDNEGKGGFERVYPPEESIDLKATYRGRERDVNWRPFPPINQQAYQSFYTIFRPNLQVCAYALAGIQSDRNQVAAIRVSSDDTVSVWLNGQKVHENPAYRSIGFDQDVAGVHLKKGFNYVLVKICQKDGHWGFRLRLTQTDGSPISGIKPVRTDELKGQKFEPSTTATSAVKVASAVEDMQQYLNKNPTAESHRQFGYLLQWKNSRDSTEQAHVAAYQQSLKADPKDVKTLLLLAEQSLDHNKQREYFERAIQADPKSADALYGLSTYYRSRRNTAKQIELLKKALEVDPTYYPAELVLAYDYTFMPLRGLGWKMVKPMKERFPEVAWVDYQTGVIASALGYKEESAEAYARYLDRNWTNNAVRNYLINYHLGKQDLKQGLNLYDEVLEVDPGRLDIVRTKALLLANNGKLKHAIAELKKNLDISPEDSETLQLLGDLLRRKGDVDAALVSWRKSLDIHPQNPNLREYLEFYATDDAFELPYLVDTDSLAREPLDESKYREEDNAVDLAHVVVIKVHANGATSKFTQRVTRILTERGTRLERFPSVYYTASKEMARIESYRIIRKGGLELTSGDISERRVVQGEHNTFYDYRAKTLRLPQLEIGDTVEVKYRVSDVARRNYFGEHFGRVEMFRSAKPVRLKRMIVIAPKTKKLYYYQKDVAPPEVAEDGEWNTYLWTARHVSGIPSEPMTPPLSSIVPYVHVSSFQNWKQVADYYTRMIRDQFQLDSSVRSAVKEITADKTTELEKITALYHYLSKETRYVGLEFGIHGYLPYPAYQVFSRKYGDCKDKATLLTSMLREAKIEAQVVLVRTRLRGDLYSEPASLAAFDHAICYVPKHDLWLDCTTEFNGTKEIPEMDRGALCLRIDPETVGLERPPLATPEQNTLDYELVATLTEKGALEGSGKLSVVGMHAPAYRNAYKQQPRQRIIFEGNVRRYHPSARILKASFSDLDNLEEPVKAEFGFKIPLFGRAQKDEILVPTTVFPERLMQQFASLTKRELPLEMRSSFSKKMNLAVTLPEHAKILHLPKSQEIKSDFGSFKFTVEQTGRQLKLNQSLEVLGRLIEPDEYPAFREFCRDVDEKHGELIRLKIVAPAESPDA